MINVACLMCFMHLRIIKITRICKEKSVPGLGLFATKVIGKAFRITTKLQILTLLGMNYVHITYYTFEI